MRISGDCFANFVADFHTTFVPVLHECHKYFMCRELVTKFLNLFKNFMRVFSPKYFARLSRYLCVGRSWECRELVAAKLWQIYNAKFLRRSYECRASVVRSSRNSATFIQMSRNCYTNKNENKLHSWESRETLS